MSFFQILGFSKPVRIALAFALLFVGSVGFYACSSMSGSEPLIPKDKLNKTEVQQENTRLSDLYEIVTVANDDLATEDDPGSPSCSCSNWACSAQGYCTDGRTCGCSCNGWFGSCSCTPCQRVLNGGYQRSQIIMTEKHRQTRLALEKHLQEQDNANLLRASKLLTEIRVALEAKDVEAYFANTAKAKEFEKNFSQDEKNTIQKWFTENGFGTIIQ